MREIKQEIFKAERSLFQGKDLRIVDAIFESGESPLKESQNIALKSSMFKWKYPLWYSKKIAVENCTFFETARAGIWYTDDISVKNTLVESPKMFRRVNGLELKNVNFPNADETLWFCSNVNMQNVTAKGDYFAINFENGEVDGLNLFGNYSFDGAKNVTIKNSKLISKDAFWNSQNITVENCFISGEYLGWNSKNLTFRNCTIESLQGLCYIENLVMKNCRLLNTTLAFEYSTVDAELVEKVDSVLNPSGGKIHAEHIGEFIVDKRKVDPSKTVITCPKIDKICDDSEKCFENFHD